MRRMVSSLAAALVLASCGCGTLGDSQHAHCREDKQKLMERLLAEKSRGDEFQERHRLAQEELESSRRRLAELDGGSAAPR